MSNSSNWLPDFLRTHFSHKVPVSSLCEELEKDPEFVERTAKEIQEALDLYNSYLLSNSTLGVENSLLINATHLKTIWPEELPAYNLILRELQTNSALFSPVITELTTLDYFREVYELPKATWILQNILILVYRTSLLHLYPSLRKNGAQISSVIEEMISILYISGKDLSLVEASNYWIQQWESEGFSPQLAKKLNKVRMTL